MTADVSKMEISAFDLGSCFFKRGKFEHFPKWKQLRDKYTVVKMWAGESDKSTRGVAKALLIYASGKAFLYAMCYNVIE